MDASRLISKQHCHHQAALYRHTPLPPLCLQWPHPAPATPSHPHLLLVALCACMRCSPRSMHRGPHPDCTLRSSTAHGGSGLILSVGLLRRLNVAHAIEHLLTIRGCGGGDCLFIRWVGEQEPGGIWQTCMPGHGRGWALAGPVFVQGGPATAMMTLSFSRPVRLVDASTPVHGFLSCLPPLGLVQ